MTETGPRHIEQLVTLASLDPPHLPISDAVLRQLANVLELISMNDTGFKRLRTLATWSTLIPQEPGLPTPNSRTSENQRPEEPVPRSTEIDDASIAYLKLSEYLDHLDLNHTEISEEGVKQFKIAPSNISNLDIHFQRSAPNEPGSGIGDRQSPLTL